MKSRLQEYCPLNKLSISIEQILGRSKKAYNVSRIRMFSVSLEFDHQTSQVITIGYRIDLPFYPVVFLYRLLIGESLRDQ